MEEKHLSFSFGLGLWRRQYQTYHLLLSLHPMPLILGHERIAAHPIFQPIELVDHDAHKEIENEDVADQYEGNEVQGLDLVASLLRLLVDSSHVYAFVHYVQPAFGRYHFI